MIPFPFQAGQLGLSGVDAVVPPILDLYGSASVAYSVRKVRTAYAGQCLRVRTSAAGNAETDIGFDAGGNIDELALMAAVGTGNTGTVVTWYDQSGNGIDATQATANAQPIIVNAGVLVKINNRVTMFHGGARSTGLASAFSIGGVVSSRQVTMAIAHKSDTTAGTGNGICVLQRSGGFDFQSGLLFERRGSTLSFTLGSGTTGAFNAANYQQYTTPNTNITAQTLAHTFIDGVGGTRTLYVDGVSGTLTSISGTLATTGFMTAGAGSHRVILGCRSQNQTNTLSDFWTGSMNEAIIWPSDQTANEAGIKANQAAYFGTP